MCDTHSAYTFAECKLAFEIYENKHIDGIISMSMPILESVLGVTSIFTFHFVGFIFFNLRLLLRGLSK